MRINYSQQFQNRNVRVLTPCFQTTPGVNVILIEVFYLKYTTHGPLFPEPLLSDYIGLSESHNIYQHLIMVNGNRGRNGVYLRKKNAINFFLYYIPSKLQGLDFIGITLASIVI